MGKLAKPKRPNVDVQVLDFVISEKYLLPVHSINWEMDTNNTRNGNHCPEKSSAWMSPIQKGVDIALAILPSPTNSKENYIECQIAVLEKLIFLKEL